MPDQETDPQAIPTFQSKVVPDLMLKRLFKFGVGLLVSAAFMLAGGIGIHVHTEQVNAINLSSIDAVQSSIINELSELSQNPPVFPEPLALKQLLRLGQSINSQSQGLLWYGQLYTQKQQYLITQAIDYLSQPIGGINLSHATRASREIGIRLKTQQKLADLQNLIEQSSSGYMWMCYVLATLLGLGGCIMMIQWMVQARTNHLAKRVRSLGKALSSQERADQIRLGASQALEGVKSILEKTHDLEHRQTLLQLSDHLQQLKQSGHSMLQFAHAFHQMSSQATHVAKTALTSEQRNLKADSHLEIMRNQLEGLREDIRNAAQGLRKAGEVSRQLLRGLDPSQLQLALTEPESNDQLQKLVEQSQHALKEAIEGLVLASQKINMGRFEQTKLAEYLAVNQTSWSNLLEQVEQYADSAASESAKALLLAKDLIQNSKNSVGKPGTDNTLKLDKS